MTRLVPKYNNLCNLFSEELIHPCSVRITPLSKELEEYFNRSSSKKKSANIPLNKDRWLKTKCIYCENTFPSRLSMVRHLKTDHSDLKPTKCAKCKLFFRSKREKTEHEKMHPKETFPCMYCNSVYERTESYRQHVRSKHRHLVIECKHNERCCTFFKTQQEKDEHVAQTLKMFECIYCRKIYRHKVLLAQHIRLKHKHESYSCTFKRVCFSFFLTLEERDKHVREQHLKKQTEKVQCIYCGNDYTGGISLALHVNDMHSQLKIKCRFHGCVNFFHTEQQHEIHFEQVHGEDDRKKIHKCHVCGYRCGKRDTLTKHTARMHGEEKLKCALCSRVCKSKIALRAHLRTKHVERKICPHCNKSVKKLGTHVKHYLCEFCDKTFPCSGVITKHLSECREKYQCRICGRRFKWPARVQSHLAAVHVPRIGKVRLPFRCRACFDNFDSLAEKEAHEKTPRHVNNVRGAPFTCDHCKKQKISLRCMVQHLSGCRKYIASFCA